MGGFVVFPRGALGEQWAGTLLADRYQGKRLNSPSDLAYLT
jgi:hypothetical protein